MHLYSSAAGRAVQRCSGVGCMLVVVLNLPSLFARKTANTIMRAMRGLKLEGGWLQPEQPLLWGSHLNCWGM